MRRSSRRAIAPTFNRTLRLGRILTPGTPRLRGRMSSLAQQKADVEHCRLKPAFCRQRHQAVALATLTKFRPTCGSLFNVLTGRRFFSLILRLVLFLLVLDFAAIFRKSTRDEKETPSTKKRRALQARGQASTSLPGAARIEKALILTGTP